MSSGAGRRAALHRLTAALILAAALAALAPRPESRTEPPPPPPSGAAYRPDGGQVLSAGGALNPNALTGLNLGRQVDPAATPAVLLAALPGLGRAGAARAAASGCLNAKQRPALAALVKEKETCVPTKP